MPTYCDFMEGLLKQRRDNKKNGQQPTSEQMDQMHKDINGPRHYQAISTMGSKDTVLYPEQNV